MKAVRIFCLGISCVSLAPIGALASATPNQPIYNARRLAEVNRSTWGMAISELAPTSTAQVDSLPPSIEAQIEEMRITREPMIQIVREMDLEKHNINAISDLQMRKAASSSFRKKMIALSEETKKRAIFRYLYSADQIREQMTWFWFNHFNVDARKRDIWTMASNYEDVIRDHSLGRFRDLIEATLRHPAMLRYLDNDQSSVGKVNENYAREIMELHSMGVDSEYSQKDVQELARILTGVSVSPRDTTPNLSAKLKAFYVKDGLFEFNPARHDFGDKVFLGHAISGTGFSEVEKALDLICNSPATAVHVSTQIATYFMGNTPPPSLIKGMVQTWKSSDGNISAVLDTMMRSPEYQASLGKSFKDPLHYVVSAIRLAYDGQVIENPEPIIKWLRRMGQNLYEHQTPDGYPLDAAAWSGPGQMTVRFEVADAIGSGAPNLFYSKRIIDGKQMGTPQLRGELWLSGLEAATGQQTLATLKRARTPKEWNILFLSSPEFMRR